VAEKIELENDVRRASAPARKKKYVRRRVPRVPCFGFATSFVLVPCSNKNLVLATSLRVSQQGFFQKWKTRTCRKLFTKKKAEGKKLC
jgi:hypothetical protein